MSSAILLALASSLASYNFSVCKNPTLLASAAWLPLSLYLQNRVDGSRSIKQIACLCLAAFCISQSIYGGRPEVFLFSEILIFANCFSECIRSFVETGKTKFSNKTIMRLASFFAGLLFAAPLIIPVLEWSAISPRANGLLQKDSLTWSANAYDFMAMLLSYPIGDPCLLSNSSSVIQNLLLSRNQSVPFLSSAYVGPIIFVLSIFGLADKENKFRFYLLGTLIFSVLLAAGENTFLLPLLLKICPPLSLVRYPVKLLIFPTLLLNLLAAFGLSSVLNKRTSSKIILSCTIVFSVLALIGVAGTFSTSLIFFGHQYLNTGYGESIKAANHSLSVSLLICGALGTTTCLLSFFEGSGKLPRHFFAIIIALGTCLSLYFSSASFPGLTKSGFYNEESKLFSHLNKFLEDDKQQSGVKARILPLYTEAMAVGEKFDAQGKPTYEEKYFAYSRNLGRGNSTIDFGTPQSFGYEATVTKPIFDFAIRANQYSSQYIVGNHPLAVSDLPLHRFCQITASQYVLTQAYLLSKELPLPQLDDKQFELFGKSLGNNSRIFKVINPRSRIHFAQNLVLDTSLDSTLEKLCDPEEIEDDLLVCDHLLDNETNRQLKTELENNRSNSSQIEKSTFVVKKDDVHEIELLVDARKNELLILSDQYYPGWNASVDGKASEILQANLINRAIRVPEGKHVIRFYYFAESLAWGLTIAAAALIGLLGFSLIQTKAKSIDSAESA